VRKIPRCNVSDGAQEAAKTPTVCLLIVMQNVFSFAHIVKKESQSMVYGHGKALDNRRLTRTQGDQYFIN